MSRKRSAFWGKIRRLVKSTSIRAYRRMLLLVLVSLLGLMTTLSIPALPVASTSEAIAQTPNAQSLLQRGIELYETQRFSEAADVWQQAVSTFETEGDNLSQALVLSNLSLAYQHLGQWQDAEGAIAKSLNLLKNQEDSAHSKAYAEILAKALNSQGRLQWAKGQMEEALETWKQAAANYAQAGNQTGVIISLINQAKALQALGLSTQAELRLQHVYEILKQESDPQLKSAGLQNLGNALRRVGILRQIDRQKGSLEVLQESLEVARAFKLSQAERWALLELGNTHRALADRAIAIGKDSEAQEHTQEAKTLYQQAAASNLPTIQLQAQLNQLSFLVETGQWSEAGQLWPQTQPLMANLPPSRINIYAQLNFARSLTCLKSGLNTDGLACMSRDRSLTLAEPLRPPKTTPSWSEIAQILATAVQQARSLNDRTAESYALGQLGGLYELTEQWSTAQELSQQALLFAQETQAPDLHYRWEWQLGRLLEKQGDIKGAIAAYQEAIQTLKSVRSDLLTINSDVQFSFRDNVEPIHRKLVDLLLRTEGNSQPSQDHLQQAIEVIDSLQLAELENFLNCNLSQTVQLNQDLDQVDNKAAFIYPIILEDRFAVIFKLPGQPLRHYANPIQQATVEQTLRELRTALLRSNAGRVIEKSQDVYSWLILPLEAYLESSEVETLVFVLDGELRNIPMSVLYDKKADEYLIQKKYALALLPSSQLFDLATISGKLHVLAAGISEEIEVENRPFNAIKVTEELEQVKNTVSSTILLNSQFTQDNLQQNINLRTFSTIHMATHGNFSSDPEETYILTYSKLLRTRDLNNLLRGGARPAASPLELLVLSACKTAEGDNRATLGIAGLAVRSGARSTLATLWQVSDDSTVKLMTQFYKELNQGGVTKAEALHRAQKALVTELKYQNPYNWAPYVLVGNWR